MWWHLKSPASRLFTQLFVQVQIKENIKALHHWPLRGNAQFGSKSAIHCPVWPRNLTDDLENNRASLLCCFKLCASFHSHRWIQTKVTVRKPSIRVKIGNLLSRVTLKFYGWPWKKNKAPLLCCFKLYASFHSHWWIQTKVTVRKRPIWVKINDLSSRVTLKFDRWPSKTIEDLS